MQVIEYLANETLGLVRRLQRLEVDGYDDHDVGAVARDGAAIWERSLKASKAAWSAARTTLHRMGEELRAQGWSYTDALHVVREAANADKHEVGPSAALPELLLALQELAGGCADLGQVLPGCHAAMPERARRRRMLCGAYEMFHAGETQYSFFAANTWDTWRTVVEIDAFQVENKHTAELEAALSDLEGWVVNPPEFEQLAASLRESDNELWMTASFTASYEDVLGILAPYQHALPLLPGLHREDQTSHVAALAVRAFLEGRESLDTAGRDVLRADRIQARVSRFLQQVPQSVGPLRLDRCDSDGFRAACTDAICSDDALGVAVRSDGLVFVRV